MLTAKERAARDEEIRAEWLALMGRVRRANLDFIDRAESEGVTFELDDDDTLRITIGSLPPMFYTQRTGPITMHLKSGTDEIVGFVIASFARFAEDRREQTPAFHELLPGLRHFKKLQLPAKSQGAHIIGEDLQRELVPA